MQKLALTTLAALCLSACASFNNTPTLTGVAAIGGPLANAQITVVDSLGVKKTTTADARGAYTLDASGLTAPLMIQAVEAGKKNCRFNNAPVAKCLVSLLPAIQPGVNVANLNPLADRVTSDVAVQLKYIGPQQLFDSGKTPAIPQPALAEALKQQRAGFKTALVAAGIANVEAFDPVSRPMQADGKGVDAVLSVIHHNRNYDNNSGEAGFTTLTDISFRPIVSLYGKGEYEALDFKRAQSELAAIKNAKIRILIVGDSTAATYEQFRAPRMGWGQVFQNQFKAGGGVVVLNGARAGRSSRDFYNGGWYGQMARFMQAGDYVVINHGHNDQNCDSKKPVRGAADVANLCSYPNDAQGKKQFPAGQPQMSFQNSLENYVKDAKARGAIPFMMTPTTRFWNADRKEAYKGGDTRPVVSNHFTFAGQGKGGYAYVGDYSQTIKDTAKANQLPLIDLEAKTIAFANAHASDWQNYWLVIRDTKTYPWYATQKAGVPAKPDTTHLQEAGARAFADLVAQGIKETAELKNLAQLLK